MKRWMNGSYKPWNWNEPWRSGSAIAGGTVVAVLLVFVMVAQAQAHTEQPYPPPIYCGHDWRDFYVAMPNGSVLHRESYQGGQGAGPHYHNYKVQRLASNPPRWVLVHYHYSRPCAPHPVLKLITFVPLHSELAGAPPKFCGHGSIQWTSGATTFSEVFNFHPSAGKHNVTVYVWSRTSLRWVVVHRHPERACPH